MKTTTTMPLRRARRRSRRWPARWPARSRPAAAVTPAAARAPPRSEHDHRLGPVPPVRRDVGLGEVPPGLRTDGHHAHAHLGRDRGPAQQPDDRGQGRQRARRRPARQPGRARTRPAPGCSRRPSDVGIDTVRLRREPRRPGHGRRRDLRRPDRREHARPLLQRGHPQRRPASTRPASPTGPP